MASSFKVAIEAAVRLDVKQRSFLLADAPPHKLRSRLSQIVWPHAKQMEHASRHKREESQADLLNTALVCWGGLLASGHVVPDSVDQDTNGPFALDGLQLRLRDRISLHAEKIKDLCGDQRGGALEILHELADNHTPTDNQELANLLASDLTLGEKHPSASHKSVFDTIRFAIFVRLQLVAYDEWERLKQASSLPAAS